MIKKNYFRILGPEPRFVPVSPLSGCAPFTLKVRNFNGIHTRQNIGNLGDSDAAGTYLTFSPSDSVINLEFKAKRGVFRIYLTQTDTFHDSYGNLLPPCTADWPLPDDTTQYYVTVNPNNTLRIQGPRVLNAGDTGSWNATSELNEYSMKTWHFGNGKILYFDTRPSVFNSYTLEQSKSRPVDSDGRARFVIRVTGQTDESCTAVDTFAVFINYNQGQSNGVINNVVVKSNPFMDETTLTYSVTKNTQLEIELDDMIGRRIRTIKNESASPGNYSIIINATDQILCSGIYLLRISTDAGRFIIRLLKL